MSTTESTTESAAEQVRLARLPARHPSRRRQEMRTFSVYAMRRWLGNAGVAHTAYRLLNGAVRVYAWPTRPLDRLALARFGFADGAGLMYRNADDAPAWVPLAPQVRA